MVPAAARRYYQKTGKKYVYSIMPISNIPSVLKNGILCYERVAELQHSSVALSEVQDRRDRVMIPNGLALHQYANLYFSYNNPMLSKRRDIANELCILAVSADVLDIEGCIVSDRNAAAALARFYLPLDGLEHLDFERIHAQFWTHDDAIEYRNHKTIKCAEILVPEVVPPKYVAGAYVVDNGAQDELIQQGFPWTIVVRPSIFFRHQIGG